MNIGIYLSLSIYTYIYIHYLSLSLYIYIERYLLQPCFHVAGRLRPTSSVSSDGCVLQLISKVLLLLLLLLLLL